MLNFCSLYSGSSGNSLFVETENTRVLIDAGMSCKKIEEALHSIDVDPFSIDSILVTLIMLREYQQFQRNLISQYLLRKKLLMQCLYIQINCYLKILIFLNLMKNFV